MKALFSLLILMGAATPALAENVGDTHCPQYLCSAASANGAEGHSETYTPAQAKSEALESCAANGGTHCRIVKCEFHKLINVWGACLEPGGLLNPRQ